MSARPIASGTISFGLVSIPVKVYAASNASAAISFNLLHAKDASRMKQQYVCIKDGEIVASRRDGQGLRVLQGPLRHLHRPRSSRPWRSSRRSRSRWSSSCPISKVDPIYFDRTYYLGTDKGGAKAYALLSKVMQATGRVALARYAARGKQYLVMLRPSDRGLVMQQLLYADEVRSFEDVPVESAEVSAKELDLAKLLVEQRAADGFAPETYEDDVRKRVLALIQKKVEGQEISLVPQEAGGGQIIDLMEALKASLGKKPESGSPRRGAQGGRVAGRQSRKPAKRAAAGRRA